MAGLAQIIPIHPDADLLAKLPTLQGRIDRQERWQTNNRWGDLGGSQLQAVLDQASRGDVADYADLVEFAVTTDPDLLSLYTTRIVRVAQADYIVVPNPFGNPQQAELAAEFVNEQLARIDNFQDSLCALLHAIALGYSASEMVWERDANTQTHYVESIVERHAHRFRYDLQWKLRLYDHGRRRGPVDARGYGEALDPETWILHTHKEVAGYPGIGGVMRACIWRWMFARWSEKWRMNYLEKYGSPFIYGKVPAGTPEAARNALLDSLMNMTAEHAAVIEQGDEIVIEPSGTQSKGDDSFDKYQQFVQRSLAKAWLGASDIVDPGASGSQAAVTTRTSAVTDPRMVSDGTRICQTLKRTLIKQIIWRNAHKFDVAIGQVPLPDLKLKTADDEVKTDKTAKAGEVRDQAASPDGLDINSPVDPTGGDASSNQLTAEELISRLPKRNPPPPPQQKQMSMRVPCMIKHEGNGWNVYSEDGDTHLGGPYKTKGEAEARLREVEHFKKKGAIQRPKASAPASTRGRQTKTSGTSGRLATPVARVLRGESDE